jgi:hypothetical protein
MNAKRGGIELEELESRGINPYWDKTIFRRELEKQAEQNGVLLDQYEKLPFDCHQLKYFYVIQTLFEQQKTMYNNNIHTIEHRIMNTLNSFTQLQQLFF